MNKLISVYTYTPDHTRALRCIYTLLFPSRITFLLIHTSLYTAGKRCIVLNEHTSEPPDGLGVERSGPSERGDAIGDRAEDGKMVKDLKPVHGRRGVVRSTSNENMPTTIGYYRSSNVRWLRMLKPTNQPTESFHVLTCHVFPLV